MRHNSGDHRIEGKNCLALKSFVSFCSPKAHQNIKIFKSGTENNLKRKMRSDAGMFHGAPTYRPSLEELEDPLLYIRSISTEAKKYGMCKIILPARPVHSDKKFSAKLKFQAKKQRLSLLDAGNRQSRDFDHALRVYSFVKGNPLPSKHDGKTVLGSLEIDLYRLYTTVRRYGTRNEISVNEKWVNVAESLGYRRSNAKEIQGFYDKYVEPFTNSNFFLDFFLSPVKNELCLKRNYGLTREPATLDHGERHKKFKHVKNGTGFWAYRSEYKKCIWGVVHRTPQRSLKIDYYIDCNNSENNPKSYLFSENISKSSLSDLVANGGDPIQAELVELGEICEICGIASDPIFMVHCNSCLCYFHCSCLDDVASEWNPKYDWFCSECCSSIQMKNQPFGYSMGGTYSVSEFQLETQKWEKAYASERCLSAKLNEATIEDEYWSLLGPNPPKRDVEVMYGSDLDTSVVGSGFPTKSLEEDEFVDSIFENFPLWNLNLIPKSKYSLLKHLECNVTGVTIPWLYIGSMFSSFCWHVEDHHLYSINYHHFGSSKRWYAIPESHAEKFEELSKLLYPQLFTRNPDLLYDLVTMIHPSLILDHSIPVTETTQRPGEFIVTFPRAYHAGFNMGFNCAEAVNFALPDWLNYGFNACKVMRKYSRPSVFSHDGLIMKIINDVSSISDSSDSRLFGKQLLLLLLKEVGRMRQSVQMEVNTFSTEPMDLFFEKVCARSVRRQDNNKTLKLCDDLIKGPKCVICNVYCYNVVVICEKCVVRKGVGKKACSCSMHANELCVCPLSTRSTFVRYTAKELENVEDHLMMLLGNPSSLGNILHVNI